MITKKIIIIFLLIIALIIILIIKHKNTNINTNTNNKVEILIENFKLNLDIEEENDYENLINKYYNNNMEYTPIINNFGIIETNNIDIQNNLNLENINTNTYFNNLNTKTLNTDTFDTKNATISNINSSGNIQNTTDNYNKFTKLNTENSNTNSIINSNNTNIKNISILDNLNIANKNFTNSTMYVDSLCFDNKCFDKSIFDNINKIDIIKQQYSSPLNQYMYLPNSRNTNGSIINDKNLIWNNIKNEITPNNNSDGKLKSVNGTWALDYNTTLWKGKNIYKILYPSITVQTTRRVSIWFGLDSTNVTTSTTKILYHQYDGSGIEVRVPEHPNKANGEDYTVLWVQTINGRWSCFRVYEYDINNNVVVKYFHKHISGFNNLNKISPDGSTHNDVWNEFEWTPVPINLTGNIQRKVMISIFFETDDATKNQAWFSGIAFSTNPWNHYKCHALELHWQIHKLDANNNLIREIDNTYSYIKWWANSDGDAWNNTRLAYFDGTASSLVSTIASTLGSSEVLVYFRIPFVNSGKDKIFYLVEHNSNYDTGTYEVSILYNNVYKSLGNFRTTFQNPFATHFNSKMYQRYYAVRIPKELLPPVDSKNNNFINFRLSLYKNESIYFTEVGTHDESPF